MTANFFMLVFKKSAKCLQRILPICQSVSFACCRQCFRPFGINAAYFAGSLFPKNTANLSKCVICMWQTVFQAIWHQCYSFRWIIVSKEYCQSVSFACGRRGFRPFGINAAPFAGLSSRIFDNVIAK